MNNNMNTILVLLTITAAILGAILIGSYTAQPAYGGNVCVKQGDYVIGPLQLTDKRDGVYVIDVAAKKLNVYGLNPQSGKIVAGGQTIDLDKAFAGRN